MSEPAKALIDMRPYDCIILSASDIKDGHSFLTIIRRDETTVGAALTLQQIEYWHARLESILDRAKGK
jgi:hypothetical protein